jgi:negative regulator of replication initiation
MSFRPYEVSEFAGQNTVSTRVDDELLQFIEWAADQAGVSTCEFLRRLIQVYRLSKQGDLTCPDCREEIRLSV